MLRITCVIVDRANYGRLKPLLKELHKDEDIDLSVICCGSTVLKRFHTPVTSIGLDFKITHRIYHSVEGSNEFSTVHSMSLLMPQLALALEQNKPDYVLIIGDRFEALAVATVASMMQLCIIHLQGGEISGNIDNAIRNAITKLAHYHVPATNKAYQQILNMGEKSIHVLAVGCPTADYVVHVNDTWKESILCIYHPETGIRNNIVLLQLLEQLKMLNRHVLMFWPNIDSGSDGLNKAIRRFISETKPDWLEMIVNVSPEEYVSMLASVRCCVGNSSSFVRDITFLGTPVVLIGKRQLGRLLTDNVKWVYDYDLTNLYITINQHMQKKFPPTNIFGTYGISKKIVDAIKQTQPYQLKVQYV